VIVVDASLAAKLVVAEADSDEAEAWFERAEEISAPDLIVVEVVQAVVRRVNDRRTTSEVGLAAIAKWRNLLAGQAINLFRSDPEQVATAAELAIILGHPVKDCLYLVLAMEHGGTLITADARFHARAHGRYPIIELFGS
jgi:predicted nucleic acid-binding protein